jgi:hypothetical protein
MLKNAEDLGDTLSELLPETFLKNGLKTAKLADPDSLLSPHPNDLCQLFKLVVVYQLRKELDPIWHKLISNDLSLIFHHLS